MSFVLVMGGILKRLVIMLGIFFLLSVLSGVSSAGSEYESETLIVNDPGLFTSRAHNIPTYETMDGYELAPIIQTGHEPYSFKMSPSGYDVYWGSKSNQKPIVLMHDFYEDLEVKWTFRGYVNDTGVTVNPFTQDKPFVIDNMVYWFTDAIELQTITTANGIIENIIIYENGTDFFNANGDYGISEMKFKFEASWPLYINGTEITTNGTYYDRDITFSNGSHDYQLKAPKFYHGVDGYSYPSDYKIVYNTDWEHVIVSILTELQYPDFLNETECYPLTIDPTLSIWYTGYLNTIIRDCDWTYSKIQICYGDENIQFFRTGENEYEGGYSTPNSYWTDSIIINWTYLGGGSWETEMYLTGYFKSLTQGPYAVISKIKISTFSPYIEWVQNLTVAQSVVHSTGVIVDVSYNYTGSGAGMYYFLGRDCIQVLDSACGATIYELFYEIDYTANTTVNKVLDSQVMANSWQHGDYINAVGRYLYADRNGKMGELDLNVYTTTTIFNMPTHTSSLRYAGIGFEDGDIEVPTSFTSGGDKVYITAKVASGHGRVIIWDANTDTLHAVKYLNETGFDGYWAYDVDLMECVAPYTGNQCFWVTSDEIGIGTGGKLGLWYSTPVNQSWQYNLDLPFEPYGVSVWGWSGTGGEGMLGSKTGNIMGWNQQSQAYGNITSPLEGRVYYAPLDDQYIVVTFKILSNESENIGWNITMSDQLSTVFYEQGTILESQWVEHPLSDYYYQKINVTTGAQYQRQVYTIELKVYDDFYSGQWILVDTHEFVICNGSRAYITAPGNSSTHIEGNPIQFTGLLESTFESWQIVSLPLGDHLLDNTYNWTIKNATGGTIWTDHNRTFSRSISTDGTYKVYFNGWDGLTNSNETYIDLIIIDRPTVSPGDRIPGDGGLVDGIDDVCDGTQLGPFCIPKMPSGVSAIAPLVTIMAGMVVILSFLTKKK